MAVENFLGSSDWTAFRLCGSFALESWHALVEEFDIRDAKCLKRCSFQKGSFVAEADRLQLPKAVLLLNFLSS